MVKVFCDMCGREIDYEVDGVNLDFNHYGVVNFKTPYSRCCGRDAVQGLRAQHIAVRAYPAVWKAGDADVPQQAFAMQQAQCWRERFLQLWRTEGVQKC